MASAQKVGSQSLYQSPGIQKCEEERYQRQEQRKTRLEKLKKLKELKSKK